MGKIGIGGAVGLVVGLVVGFGLLVWLQIPATEIAAVTLVLTLSIVLFMAVGAGIGKLGGRDADEEGTPGGDAVDGRAER